VKKNNFEKGLHNKILKTLKSLKSQK